MMEEIHLDTSGPAAAPTVFYSNKTLSAPMSPPLAPPRPPGKNIDNGGNHGGNTSSNTTVVSHGATTNDGRGPPSWPTYVHSLQGHIAIYPGPSPIGQQRSQAFMATKGLYTLPFFVPEKQQLYQQAPHAPPSGWAPWNGVG
jgi:hypothetical protein